MSESFLGRKTGPSTFVPLVEGDERKLTLLGVDDALKHVEVGDMFQLVTSYPRSNEIVYEIRLVSIWGPQGRQEMRRYAQEIIKALDAL